MNSSSDNWRRNAATAGSTTASPRIDRCASRPAMAAFTFLTCSFSADIYPFGADAVLQQRGRKIESLMALNIAQ